MPKTRKAGKNGGSGWRFQIPNNILKANTRKLKTMRRGLTNRHPNLTNSNLENLHVVNTNTKEWNIVSGNRNTYVPKNLRPPPKTIQFKNMKQNL